VSPGPGPGPGPRTPRIAIVGSTSPVGKELREFLESDSQDWNLTLLDTDEYAGLLQEFAGKIEIVNVISPKRLADVDVAVFTCAPQFLKEYLDSGAYLPPITLDVTGGDRNGPVYVDGLSPELKAAAKGPLIAPRADTLVLSHVLNRLHLTAGVRASEATILESASEKGSATMDKLQEETVQILTFQQEEDTRGQLAFNIVGPDEAQRRRAARVARQIGSVVSDGCPAPALQFASVSMFQGMALSVHVRLVREVSTDQLVRILTEGSLLENAEKPPTPQNVLGAGSMQLAGVSEGADPNAFWLWIVTDNLRLAAENTARLIRSLTYGRPSGPPQ
jgi:aspartate-semialdehyde dehydrogenase